MNQEAQKKLTKARAGLVLDQPFFASIALRLRVQEDPACQSAWTDGKTLGYSPDWVQSLTLDEIKGVLCHEVMHVALLHNLRRDQRDPQTWNAAGDYAINPIVLDAKMTLPKDGLIERAYENMAAEEIYNRLPKPPPQSGGSGKDKDKGSDPGQCGEVRDYPGPDGHEGPPTPAQIAQQEQEQKIATQQALTAAKRAGNLPGSLERLIDELLEPMIPWREVLARFVDSHAANDYTWQQPNRRYAAHGLYLPALRNPELGHLMLAVDTSGSISQTQINEFVGEIRGILRAYDNTSLTVIFCDHAVQGDPVTLDQDTETEALKPKGGGGTSFVPPFTWAEETGLQPKATIYFTDGCCNDFPDVQEQDTLWVLTEKNENFNPPFGETIFMEK